MADIYALHGSAVVKQTNGTGAFADTGLTATNLRCVAVAPNGDILACGSASGYIWKFTQAGQEWVRQDAAGANEWYAIRAASNGDIYAAARGYREYGGGVYKQAGGTGSWTSQGFTPTDRNWHFQVILIDGTDVYVGCTAEAILKQSGGTGNFDFVTGPANCDCLAVAPNGDIWAGCSDGNVWLQEDGETEFVNQNVASSWWPCVACDDDSTVYVGEFWMERIRYRAVGGSFDILSGKPSGAPRSMHITDQGDMYLGIASGDIYKWAGMTGSWTAQSAGSHDWVSIASTVTPSGFDVVGTGGLILGGSASVQFADTISVVGTGGFVVGGSATVEAPAEVAGSGGLLLGGSADVSCGLALTIDHTAIADFATLTSTEIGNAASLTLMLRRASVGGIISDALDTLESGNASLDRANWDFQYEGNPGWATKLTHFAEQCASRHASFVVLTMKFCYIDYAADAGDYIATMEAQEAAYPDNTFIWWTMPIEAVDNLAATSAFNTAIREYCAAHGKILYDIADIESHHADGSESTSGGYPNLCSEYDSGDHGHPNATGSARLAQAFWVLMSVVYDRLNAVAGFEETASGGFLVGGSAVVDRAVSTTSAGGLLVGGSSAAELAATVTSTGGFVIGGTSPVTLDVSATSAGGAVVGGSGTVSLDVSNVSAGGLLIGGSAPVSFDVNVVGSGGAILGGEAVVSLGGAVDVTSTGGFVLGGAAEVEASIDVVGVGGFVLGGHAEIDYPQAVDVVGAGGFVLGGSAVVEFAQDATGTGGFIVGGATIVTAGWELLGTGGVILGGHAIEQAGADVRGAGGFVFGGQCAVEMTIDVVGSGGFVIGGTAEESTRIPAAVAVTLSAPSRIAVSMRAPSRNTVTITI